MLNYSVRYGGEGMSHIILLLFEIIGTLAFAVSGAMTALSKKMDAFGITALGLITAVGGGVIRDLVLGNTPPATFKNPTYIIIAFLASFLVFIPFLRKSYTKNIRVFEYVLLLMDSLGLAVFTVAGINTAIKVTNEFNIFLLLFVGVITGTGGGVLRDILAQNTPYIFVKHFYATASLLGAGVCIALWNFAGEIVSMCVGAIVIFVLRMLAAHFHWNLPK